MTPDLPEETLKLEGFDDAIVGVATVWSSDGPVQVLAYDEDVILKILMKRDGMIWEDAREFFDFNIAGGYLGPHTPIYVTQLWRLLPEQRYEISLAKPIPWYKLLMSYIGIKRGIKK